jgi:hypothetical protein
VSIVRLWRAKGASDFASETIGEADLGGREGGYSPRAVFSPSGSSLATSFIPRTRNGLASTLALCKLQSMTETQSVVMLLFIATYVAVSPDSKQLVVVGRGGGFDFFKQTISAFKETS